MDNSVFAVKDDSIVDFIPSKRELVEEGIQDELHYNVFLTLEATVQESRQKIKDSQDAPEKKLMEQHTAASNATSAAAC